MLASQQRGRAAKRQRGRQARRVAGVVGTADDTPLLEPGAKRGSGSGQRGIPHDTDTAVPTTPPSKFPRPRQQYPPPPYSNAALPTRPQ